ncbi:putative r2r3-myb transcription factor [Corchorus olitorius]|uniref:R2r3-myb transcription factor n=1 Tax=Corchorus olitorius TaxID=93759 RepID=A0A1R3FV73_9ROSI|nr:putative r2r3-myb transcription factor [Corchorus olitorius]
MQLQSLQNPFSSFYNNPAIWPKILPLQEKMIQTIQASDGNPNNLLMQSQQGADFYDHQQQQDYQKSSNSKGLDDQVDNSLDGISPADCSVHYGTGNNMVDSETVPKAADDHGNHLGMAQSNAGVSNFQAELDELLNSKTSGYAPVQQEDQMAEFDCFKDMNGSKDSLIWWSNDFDAKSASSNSWDSTSVLQSNGVFQDYELGYHM